MSLPNQQPPYLRYLKSQLLNLKRPSVWGTAIFLCFVGVIFREFLENPTNIFAFNQQQDKPLVNQQPANSGLTEDERASFADIDNLPVFLNDYQQGTLSILPTISPVKNQNQKGNNFLEEAIKKQNAANEAKSKANLALSKNSPINNLKNPFVLQAETLLQPDVSLGNGQFLGYRSLNSSLNQPTESISSSSFGVGLTNRNRQVQDNGLISPLAPVLNQLNNQNSPNNYNQINQNSTTSATSPYPSTNQNFPSFTNTNTTSISPFGSSFDARTTGIPNQTLPASTGMGYVDPSITKPLQNTSGSLNNNQTLPNQTIPVTGIPPVINTAPNNNYLNQTQGAVNSTSPAGYGNDGSSNIPQSNYRSYGPYRLRLPVSSQQSNYGNYGSYGVQQPTQLPQSTYGNQGLQQPGQLPYNSTYPGQTEQYQNNYPNNYPR